MNICWYKDDELAIYFDKEPKISVLYLKPNCKSKVVYKKPFRLQEKINVYLFDYINEKEYSFLIPDNYSWDGASIPRLFWRLFGSNTDNKFLIPSLIHDILCENHDYIDDNRGLSTLVFDCLLKVSRVHPFNRWLIKHSVDNYQKFCGW